MMEALFDDNTKPFYKFGDILYLPRVPANYWVKYITDKFKQEEKQITRKQALWIVEKVDGNSSYVQQFPPRHRKRPPYRPLVCPNHSRISPGVIRQCEHH